MIQKEEISDRITILKDFKFDISQEKLQKLKEEWSTEVIEINEGKTSEDLPNLKNISGRLRSGKKRNLDVQDISYEKQESEEKQEKEQKKVEEKQEPPTKKLRIQSCQKKEEDWSNDHFVSGEFISI